MESMESKQIRGTDYWARKVISGALGTVASRMGKIWADLHSGINTNHIILWIGSGSYSDFKFDRNDRNGDPLEGYRSDPYWVVQLAVLSNWAWQWWSADLVSFRFNSYFTSDALSFAFIVFKSHAKWIGSSDWIGLAIQKMHVDRNAESDPIFEKDLDLEFYLKISDRWEACSRLGWPNYQNVSTFWKETALKINHLFHSTAMKPNYYTCLKLDRIYRVSQKFWRGFARLYLGNSWDYKNGMGAKRCVTSLSFVWFFFGFFKSSNISYFFKL
jgi:hypothetical protein